MLQLLHCKRNKLVSLTIQNGANFLITDFDATGNSNLQCIGVDDTAWSTSNWTQIDSWSRYSENCIYATLAKATLNTEKEVLFDSIALFPNPVTTVLNIDSKSLHLVKIEVYSILGQKVKEINFNLNVVEMYDLANGVYLIRLYSEKGVSVRKIIKT